MVFYATLESYLPSSRPQALIQAMGRIFLGTLLLAIASWIKIPLLPVPMTMQTWAVLLIGALYGSRLGALTILAYLGEALLGLPVLAGGFAGLAHLLGPTGGYLIGFVCSAFSTGCLAEQGSMNTFKTRLGSLLLGEAIVLSLGCLWLTYFIGWGQALKLGVLPFLIGGYLKAMLANTVLQLLQK